MLSKPFTLLALAPLLDREGQPAADLLDDVAPAGPGARDLAAALDDPQQLHVVYQPKVTALGQRLTGFEVLARWEHPTLGPVSPAHFVPLAERNGLIDRLTACVVDQALPWFASLRRPTLSLAVNLSAQVAGDRTFPGLLEERCRHHVVDPGKIILELTETASSDDANEALRMLTRMRVRGFQLSLDDYGTGYSSMSQLARLPFTEIKIDRSFVMTSRALARVPAAGRLRRRPRSQPRPDDGRRGSGGRRCARPPGRARLRPGAGVPRRPSHGRRRRRPVGRAEPGLDR